MRNKNEKSCGGIPVGWIPNTEFDESDDIELIKRTDAREVMSPLELKAYNKVVSNRWEWLKDE